MKRKGEGPFDPYWRIVMEPDKTMDVKERTYTPQDVENWVRETNDLLRQIAARNPGLTLEEILQEQGRTPEQIEDFLDALREAHGIADSLIGYGANARTVETLELTSFREFRRNRDGITIPLRFDEWPADVPLALGSTVVGIGENMVAGSQSYDRHDLASLKHAWPPADEQASGAQIRWCYEVTQPALALPPSKDFRRDVLTVPGGTGRGGTE